MWPAIIAGAAALGSTLLTNYSNRKSSNDQRSWSLEQQKSMNEYNSPLQQRIRLRQASVNPGLAMQNGMMDVGNQSTLPSYEPATYDFSPVGEAISRGVTSIAERRNLKANTRLTDENTIAQMYRNKFGLQQSYLDTLDKIAELKHKDMDTSYLEKLKEYQEKQIDAFESRNNAEVKRIDAEARAADSQAQLADAQRETQRIINMYLPAEKRGVLRIQDSTVKELQSAANRNDAEAANAAADKILKEAQKAGVDIDNKTRKEMKDALVDDAFNRADESYWNANKAKRDYHKGIFGKFGSSSWDTPSSDRSRFGRDPRYPDRGGVR